MFEALLTCLLRPRASQHRTLTVSHIFFCGFETALHFRLDHYMMKEAEGVIAILEDEGNKEQGCVLKRIQEIRDRGSRFQQRKIETKQVLLDTAEAMDKVEYREYCLCHRYANNYY